MRCKQEKTCKKRPNFSNKEHIFVVFFTRVQLFAKLILFILSKKAYQIKRLFQAINKAIIIMNS